MNKPRKWIALYIGIWAAVVILNAIAWCSTAFCDAYIRFVFPLWVGSLGRLTGLVPFSVGEILLAVGAALVVLAAFAWILALAAKGTRRTVRSFYLFLAWTVAIVSLIMTLNCFILYHATPFSETYFPSYQGASADVSEAPANLSEASANVSEASADFSEVSADIPTVSAGFPEKGTLEELVFVRNLVVEECNRLSGEMPRDGQGNIVYDKDIAAEAISCMQDLGKVYDRLAGFYPRPKKLAASDFFSQQYMCGYFFPFTMEANYNDVMYIMNKPATICHELAHLKGYILEDEANFISFLACIRSEDPMFVYAGYLSVLSYLDGDFFKSVGRDREVYLSQVHILPQVRVDDVFVVAEEWERIDSSALINTEVVDAVSDAVVDITLKANGVSDGMVSYSRVVELILSYYRSQASLS